MKSMSCAVALVLLCMPALAANEGLVAHWPFDDVRVERIEVEMVRGETYLPKEKFAYVREEVSGEDHELLGKYYKSVAGVKGQALLLDGYTAHVAPGLDNTVYVSGDFSVEAWVALGAYPKNWCPIFEHRQPPTQGYMHGYFFGLDALGRLMFRMATNGREELLLGQDTIPLNVWTHVACSCNEGDGMSIFVNGERVGTLKPDAPFNPVVLDWGPEAPMLIAKSSTTHRPYGTIRPYGTMESHTFLDALLDELRVYDRALSSQEIAASYDENKTTAAPELPERVLPAGPKGPARFGAINANLKYYPAWDAPWQLEDSADIVVRFDETDCRFVFWHGTAYIPNWVTGNGIWFNNGFNEGWNDHGSCEPMSDKKAKYSTVKIVENNDARVVVQWRYGLVDVLGTFAFEDPDTGWGDWTNETFTVYPNMVGVRKDTLLSNAPRAAHEWQESIMVMGPGQRPDEVLEFAALSLGNMKGENRTYSWEHETPPHTPEGVDDVNIQVVNTRSKYRPFSALRPEDAEAIDIYSGEVRRDVCVFPWWNHWPVAPRPTDGRYAMFDDRASHASLSHWWWGAYETTDASMTKIMLNGLTDKTVEELVPLTKSWSNPPKLSVVGSGFTSAGYDQADMAFHLTSKDGAKALTMKLAATEDSPVVDPAFVVNNWGYDGAALMINGKSVEQGKDFRVGHRERLDGTDLIVWFRLETTERVEIAITAAKR
jgi:hypothetical protein